MAIRAMPWRQHGEKKKFKTTPFATFLGRNKK
jgi:hypothetical protein